MYLLVEIRNYNFMTITIPMNILDAEVTQILYHYIFLKELHFTETLKTMFYFKIAIYGPLIARELC